MKRLVWLVLLVIGCDGGASSTLKIEAVEPDYGPLAGGTRVVLKGQGFLADGAAPNRVVIGDREAPLAGAIDDDTLEVVIPPGAVAGPADIVVFNRNGVATTSGTFHYSEPPVIAAVTPNNVIFDSTETKITVSGSGFSDEGAGPVRVAVNGSSAIDVVVNSDSELTFTALPGIVLTSADIAIANARGEVTQERAFRYAPGTRGGLLVFAQPGTAAFLVFLDPVDGSTVTLPRSSSAITTILRAVVQEADGTYSVFDRGRRWGRLDIAMQNVLEPLQTVVNLPAMARRGGDYYGVERNSRTFGTFDPATGAFAARGGPLASFSPGSQLGVGLAFDAQGTLYMLGGNPMATALQLQTVDPATGALGVAVPIQGAPAHIVDMRFFKDTLYAVTRDGVVLSINPTTGGTALVGETKVGASALEVFE